LETTGDFVDFVPYIQKGEFEIHVYRDSDNIFKVQISNAFSDNIMLKYADLDKLKQSPSHPKHMIAVTWGNGEDKLYIDGLLVDTYSGK